MRDPFGGKVSREAAFKYRETFGTSAGKRVLLDLITRFHIMGNMYREGESTDDLLFKEGQRSVVLHILAVAQVDPAQLMANVGKEITNARRA